MAYLPHLLILVLYFSFGMGLTNTFLQDIDAWDHFKTGHLGIKVTVIGMALTAIVLLPLLAIYNMGLNYVVRKQEE